MSFNAEQRAAIDARGEVFVSAGAGTGKTAVLVERGRHDLARELDGAWISTIHGFCARLLKAYPFAAGLDPRFRELDEAQAAVLRGEAFDAALAEFWRLVESAQETAARLAGRIREGDVRHDPKGGDCPSWCDLWSMCRVKRA